MKITVDTSAADALLANARAAALNKADLHKTAASSVSKLLRGWFIARNSRSQTSNYWSEAGESVYHEADATSGRVVVPKQGVAWHRYGGVIRAKPGKALAIPLKASVKGMRASDKFPSKKDAFVYRKGGKAFLAAREGNSLRIFYLLVKSVSKAADTSVLPPDAQLSASASDSMLKLIRIRLSRRKS
jgi:hypothetical protein